MTVLQHLMCSLLQTTHYLTLQTAITTTIAEETIIRTEAATTTTTIEEGVVATEEEGAITTTTLLHQTSLTLHGATHNNNGPFPTMQEDIL